MLIDDHTAIEIQASATIGPADLKGLRALSEEMRLRRRIVVEDELEIRVRRAPGRLLAHQLLLGRGAAEEAHPEA